MSGSATDKTSKDAPGASKPAGESPADALTARGVAALGEFIKSQRRIADLSQRELARLADLSDAYLSQLERGLHEPSVRVLNGLSQALNVPADKLLGYLGRGDAALDNDRSTESTIATDDRLTDNQKQSMLDIYRAFIAANDVAGQ